jgi:hypothetical protein
LAVVAGELHFWIPPPGVGVAVLAVMAVVMTVREKMTQREKTVWVLIALAFALVEIRSISADRDKHDREWNEARREERDHFDSVLRNRNITIGNARQQFLATMDRTETIVGLEKSAIVGLSENLKTMTGGDNYCSIITLQSESNSVPLYVYNEGRYALRGVKARMVDLEKFNAFVKANPNPTIEEVTTAGTTSFNIGDMAPHTGSLIGRYSLAGEHQGLNIFFSALNGLWAETFRRCQVNGRWVTAIKVTREEFGKNGKWSERTLQEKIDPDYPRIAGRVQWQ